MYKNGDKVEVRHGPDEWVSGYKYLGPDTEDFKYHWVRWKTGSAILIHGECLRHESMKPIQPAALIQNALLLRSEDGENPEYDRALVELVKDCTGWSRERTAIEIGVSIDKIDAPVLKKKVWKNWLRVRLFNGARTMEAWNSNSPHFIDDWKPEEKTFDCIHVQVTYRDHVKLLMEDDSMVDLFWNSDDVIEHEGVFYGDFDVEVIE